MMNDKLMNVELKRIEVCDLLIALTYVSNNSDAEKWETLHDKILEMLNDFDRTETE